MHSEEEIKKYTGFNFIRDKMAPEAIDFFTSNPEVIPGARDFRNYSYLMCAASAEMVDLVKVLVEECHCDVNEFGGDNVPLTTACRAGNLEIVDYLLSAGADPNRSRCAISAINSRKPSVPKILESLISHGLDVNQTFEMFEKKDQLRTALDFALHKPEIAGLLRKHGAKTAGELESA